MLTLSVFASAVHADSVVMTNGDRLSGQVISMADGQLIFATAFAGEVKIPWDKLRNLQSDTPVRVRLADGSLLIGQLLAAPAGQTRVKAGSLPETEALPLARISALNPPMDPDKVKLGGHANLGGTFARGNTVEDTLHAEAQMVARTPTNRYTLGGEVNEASKQKASTTSNWRMNMKYDHFLRDKTYLYATSLLEKDSLANLNLRTSLGFGAGRQIFEEKRRNLSLEGGLSYVNEDFDAAADQSFPSLRAAVNFDQLLFDEQIKFFLSSEMLASLRDSSDFLLRARTGVRIPVGKSFNLSSQVNLDYDNVPAPGKDRTDSALIFSLGYGF